MQTIAIRVVRALEAGLGRSPIPSAIGVTRPLKPLPNGSTSAVPSDR